MRKLWRPSTRLCSWTKKIFRPSWNELEAVDFPHGEEQPFCLVPLYFHGKSIMRRVCETKEYNNDEIKSRTSCLAHICACCWMQSRSPKSRKNKKQHTSGIWEAHGLDCSDDWSSGRPHRKQTKNRTTIRTRSYPNSLLVLLKSVQVSLPLHVISLEPYGHMMLHNTSLSLVGDTNWIQIHQACLVHDLSTNYAKIW